MLTVKYLKGVSVREKEVLAEVFIKKSTHSEISFTAACLNDVWMFVWVILGITPRLEDEVERSDRYPIIPYNSQFPEVISRIGKLNNLTHQFTIG